MNNKETTLTVEKASKLLGITPQMLRVYLQNDKFYFGKAVQTVAPSRERPRGAWHYIIFKEPLEHYLKFGDAPVQIINNQEIN